MHSLAHELCAGRLLVTGGGGYNPEATMRCWVILLATLVGDAPSPADPRYAALFDTEDAPADPDAMGAVQEAVRALCAQHALA